MFFLWFHSFHHPTAPAPPLQQQEQQTRPEEKQGAQQADIITRTVSAVAVKASVSVAALIPSQLKLVNQIEGD